MRVRYLSSSTYLDVQEIVAIYVFKISVRCHLPVVVLLFSRFQISDLVAEGLSEKIFPMLISLS